MEKLKTKKRLLGTVMAAIMTTLVAATVMTTASGCLFCRDCGPQRAWRHH